MRMVLSVLELIAGRFAHKHSIGCVSAKTKCTHVRNGMCFNQDHLCQETCVKNTKNKLEALRDLKKRNSVPTCRFWFFRILSLMKLVDGVLKPRRVRRRGKPLVEEPYIETSAERNEQYRCKVKRAHPFRSASSDVAQANCCR